MNCGGLNAPLLGCCDEYGDCSDLVRITIGVDICCGLLRIDGKF